MGLSFHTGSKLMDFSIFSTKVFEKILSRVSLFEFHCLASPSEAKQWPKGQICLSFPQTLLAYFCVPALE